MAVLDDLSADAEMAELLADVRALLDHARGRGVTAEDPRAAVATALSATAPSAPDPPPPAASSATPPTERVGAWATLAQQARSRAEIVSATGADGLAKVRDDLGDCRRCPLCAARRNIVFGVGDPQADLFVIGEGPGYNEDVQGEPFVGDAGKMLDKMLENVLGLPREQVYIANVVKCRPPENRNPTPLEVDACVPFLRRQIAAVQPKVLLVLGAVAYKALFGSERGIKSVRGTWHAIDEIPALPTFHPAYLLRQPDDKRLVFDDLKALRARYDALGGRRA